jgi:hypothetical protein
LALGVDTPYQLKLILTTGPTAVADCSVHANGNALWWSHYKWWEFSFFGVQMPGISMNENFDNVRQYQTTNWSYTPNGQDGVPGVSMFSDNYCFANQLVAKPLPMTPQNPLGNNKVDSTTQSYKVGSSTVGQGVTVQTQTLTRYVDHPTVTDIVSPIWRPTV